jgi:DNA-binding PadR family transcriptional regulator
MEKDLADMTIDDWNETLEDMVSKGLISKVFDEVTGEPLYDITEKGLLQLEYKFGHKN